MGTNRTFAWFKAMVESVAITITVHKPVAMTIKLHKSVAMTIKVHKGYDSST